MKEKLVTNEMLVKQLEDALEERQNPDRRQRDEGLPQGVIEERRRRIDRRNQRQRS